MRQRSFISIFVWCIFLTVAIMPVSTVALTYVEGELVVGLEAGYSIEVVETSFELTAVQELTQLNVYLVDNPNGGDLLALAGQIEEMAEVKFCHPNYLISPLQPVQTSLPVSDFTGGAEYHDQAMTESLDLTTVHNVALGSSARVGIIDGGINFDHPALQGAVFSGYDYVDDDAVAFDEPGGLNSGHGTFVAGVIHLVAPEADLIGYRVTNPLGASNGYIVAEAIMQAVADGCEILNISMVTMAEHLAIHSAIEFAREAGVLVVVAAGNGHTAETHYPASDINVLAVAAIDTLNLLADFSSFGPHIDVCAPGTEINAPYMGDSYVWWGGTSFASPIVAAQAALLLSYSPGISGDSVRTLITSTASDLDYLNPDYAGQLGSGLVNPVASLVALRGTAEVLLVPSEYETIQSAIDAALHGDTVLVASGSYGENIHFNGKAIVLTSLDGPGTTIISPASPNMSTVTVRETFPGRATLNGFGITGASDARAIDVKSNWPVLITNNIIFGNRRDSAYGDIVYIDGTSATVERNIFANNTGRSTLALRPYGDGVYDLVANNVFDDNQNGIYLRGSSVFGPDLNCDIVNNILSRTQYSAVYTDATSFYEGHAKSCDNNMFWDNGTDIDPKAVPAVTFNLFDDPQFIGQDFREYHCLPGSPVIDAGLADSVFFDSDGTIGDIGAYPVSENSYPYLTGFERVADSSIEYLVPEFFWTTFDNGEGGQTRYHIKVRHEGAGVDTEVWDSGPVLSTDSSVIYAGDPLFRFDPYYILIRIGTDLEWGEWKFYGFRAGGPTIYVPDHYLTIAEALQWIELVDTIFVRPGTYYEDITLDQGDFVLISTAGPEQTVIEPLNQSSRIFQMNNASSYEINGFTFKGGHTALAISGGTNISILNNRFLDCSYSAMEAEIEGTIGFSGNHLEGIERYAIIFIGADSTVFDNNTIIRNSGYQIVNFFSCRLVEASNNLFADNTGEGTTMYAPGVDSLSITNNTFYNNGGYYSLNASGDAGQFLNNLFVGNIGRGYEIRSNDPASNRWVINYNNSFQNEYPDELSYIDPPEVSFAVDPMFVDTTDLTCQLHPNSPMIDAGDPRSQFNDPDGSRSDIGANPYQGDVLPAIVNLMISPKDSRDYVSSLVPQFSWEYDDESSTEHDQIQVQVSSVRDWLAVDTWDSGPVSQTVQAITYAGNGLNEGESYFVRVRAFNGTSWGGWREREFTVRTSLIIDVPGTFPTIQSAVDYSVSGDTIIVGPGTYQENIYIGEKDLAIISTNGATETIIEPPPGDTTNLLIVENRDGQFSLDGFTLQNATNNAYIRISDGSFTNNRFSGASYSGLYIYASSSSSSLALIDNQFVGNRYGSSISYARQGSIIRGNTFTDNYDGALHIVESTNYEISNNVFARNINDRGAAIYADLGTNYQNSPYAIIRNNTFFANDVPGQNFGGVIHFYDAGAAVDVSNNIFSYSTGGYDIYTDTVGDDSLSQFEYNNFFGNTHTTIYNVNLGAGNISVDPLFVDTAALDLSLQELSECIDAGDPSYEFVDLDMTRSDMGAIPFDLATATSGVALSPDLGDEELEGVVSGTPTFNWLYYSPSGAQTAFEVQVGTDLDWDVVENWDSGEIASSDSFVTYAGLELVDGTEYFYRVRVNNGTDWGGWRGNRFYKNTPPNQPENLRMYHRYTYVVSPTSYMYADFSDDDNNTLWTDFEIYEDPQLTTLFSSFSNIPDTSAGPIGVMAPSTSYWWRTRAFDGYEFSEWSVADSVLSIDIFGEVLLTEYTSSEVACDETIEFRLNLHNDAPGAIKSMECSFQVYSPEGAILDTVGAAWDYSSFDWDAAFITPGGLPFSWVRAYSGRQSYVSSDTVNFNALKDDLSPGVEVGVNEPGWIVSTQVSCDEIGKTVCIDTTHRFRYNLSKNLWLYTDTAVGSSASILGLPQWGGPYCFTVYDCCDGVRGDVNGDGANGNLADITALISYVYLNGGEPSCNGEANVNGDIDQRINLADITKLIDYVYISKLDPPNCGEYLINPSDRAAINNNVAVTTHYDDGKTVVVLESTDDLLGLHLLLSGDHRSTPVKVAAEELELLFSYQNDTLLTLGLFDTDGPTKILQGRSNLIVLTGHFEIVEAEAVNLNHLTIYPSLTGSAGSALLPKAFALAQNYPNPFNPTTTIKFSLPETAEVRLDIFNVLGQTVMTLLDEPLEAGEHEVIWNGINGQGKPVASGVYLYRLRAGERVESKRMLLLK